MKPNFFFVGAAKCGSTWFFKALQAHPEVFVPKAKDIYFFDQYYDRGTVWYEKFFQGDRPFKAVGEFSHNYLYSGLALRRIVEYAPDAKAIVCIREPIGRAHSAYLFMKRNGTARESFRSTLLFRREIMERGRYSNYLKDLLSVFGPDRVRIFLFDDLQSDPHGVALRLYEFLCVNKDFSYSDADKKALPASSARLQWLANLAKRGAFFTRKLGHPDLVGRIKDSGFAKLIYKPIDSSAKERVSEEDFAWLKEYYEADIKCVEDLLGRPLSNWLKYNK